MNNLNIPTSTKVTTLPFGQSPHISKKKVPSNISIPSYSGSNEYQVFTKNIETIGSSLSPDQSIAKQQQQLKKQSVTYAASFMKTFKQPNLSSENHENGGIAFNSHRKSQIINPQAISTKSSEQSGLAQASMLWMGQQSDKHLPKQNFYFPATKKGGITKRAPYQGAGLGGDKVVQENTKKKTSSMTQDQLSSKVIPSMHASLFTTSQRSSMDCLFFDKRKQSNGAFAHISPPRLPLPLETEPTLSHSSQQALFLQTPEKLDEGQLAVEIRRLQMLSNEQKQRIETLEKANADQREQLKQKQNIISDLEGQFNFSSQGRRISNVNVPSVITMDQKNQLPSSVLSSNSSFNSKEKQNFNASTAQISASNMKSRHFPHNSLVISSSTAVNNLTNSKKSTSQSTQPSQFNSQFYSASSVQDIVSPSSPKLNKEKVLSVNFHESQVKDFILKTHRHTSSQPSDQTLADSELTSNRRTSSNTQELMSESFAQSFKQILARTKKLLERQSFNQELPIQQKQKKGSNYF